MLGNTSTLTRLVQPRDDMHPGVTEMDGTMATFQLCLFDDGGVNPDVPNWI